MSRHAESTLRFVPLTRVPMRALATTKDCLPCPAVRSNVEMTSRNR